MGRSRRAPEVRELEEGHSYRERGYRYIVDFRNAEGRRITKLYRRGEKEIAKAFAEAENTRIVNHGTETAAILDDRALREAADCIRRLREHGRTLTDATNHFLAHLEANERSCTVSDLAEMVEHSKEREGKSLRYLRDLRSRYKRFEQEFGEHVVASVTSTDISNWLAELNLSPVSRNNYRRILILLFNEGIRRKFCRENPARESEKAKVVESEVSILTPTEAKRLLQHSSPPILPAIAIGLFAGLRQSELEQLDWSEIDFEEEHILVRAEKAKTARRRYVTLSENLTEWLSPFRCDLGLVSPQAGEYWTHFGTARTRAELLDRWKGNELRHSFASYHLALHKDPGLTTSELGHTSPHLVYQHYRNLVKSSAARSFWAIKPGT